MTSHACRSPLGAARGALRRLDRVGAALAALRAPLLPPHASVAFHGLPSAFHRPSVPFHALPCPSMPFHAGAPLLPSHARQCPRPHPLDLRLRPARRVDAWPAAPRHARRTRRQVSCRPSAPAERVHQPPALPPSSSRPPTAALPPPAAAYRRPSCSSSSATSTPSKLRSRSSSPLAPTRHAHHSAVAEEEEAAAAAASAPRPLISPRRSRRNPRRCPAPPFPSPPPQYPSPRQLPRTRTRTRGVAARSDESILRRSSRAPTPSNSSARA